MLIFVAYSAKDWEQVESLIVELGMLGHDIHFERKVLGGSLTWAEIFQSILRCDVFVFTVTPYTLASYSRLLEFEYALILRKSILAVQLRQANLSLLPAGAPSVIEYQPNNPTLRAAFAKTLGALPPSLAITGPIEPPGLNYLLSQLRRRISAPEKSQQEKAELLLNLRELLERRETYVAAESLLDALAPDVTPDDAIAGEFRVTYRRVRRMKASIRNRRLALAIISVLFLIGVVGGIRFIQSKFPESAASTALQQITTLLPTQSPVNSRPLAAGETLPTQAAVCYGGLPSNLACGPVFPAGRCSVRRFCTSFAHDFALAIVGCVCSKGCGCAQPAVARLDHSSPITQTSKMLRIGHDCH